MSLCRILETKINQLISNEIERTKLETEMFFNLRLQKNPQRLELMRNKCSELFAESQKLRQLLFNETLSDGEVLEMLKK